MAVDVDIKIVSLIYANANQVTVNTNPVQATLPQFPAMLMPASLQHIVAGMSTRTANSSSQADCKLVANAVVTDHFPSGYTIANNPDYTGHVWKNERWQQSAGNDFGYAWPIQYSGGQPLIQGMTVDVGGGATLALTGKFYMVVQKTA